MSRNVINNGIGNGNRPYITHAYAVAKALGVSIESLMEGKYDSAQDDNGLSQDEQELIMKFRQLGHDSRAQQDIYEILALLNAKLSIKDKLALSEKDTQTRKNA